MLSTYFDDVLTFDTTYLTNIYQMLFCPFVGVNHHGQSILLGYKLLSDERTKIFKWIFQSWVDENWGQPPNAIITNQAKTIKVAIKKVFLNIRHQFCLWCILKKISKKIGHICTVNPKYMTQLSHRLSRKGRYNSWRNMKNARL